MVERLKKKTYQQIFSNDFFWRTYAQKEIDLIEEREGKLFAYEFKWKARSYMPPKAWSKNYPESAVMMITQDNFFDFVS